MTEVYDSFYKEFEKQCMLDIEAFQKIKKARTVISKNGKERIELFLMLLGGKLKELMAISIEEGTITQKHFDEWKSSKTFQWEGFYSLFISSLTSKEQQNKKVKL